MQLYNLTSNLLDSLFSIAPLFCGPKEGKNDFTGGWGEYRRNITRCVIVLKYSVLLLSITLLMPALLVFCKSFTDYGFMCNVGWVDPPIVCDVYEGQSAGRFDNSEPVPNRNGRDDVEGEWLLLSSLFCRNCQLYTHPCCDRKSSILKVVAGGGGEFHLFSTPYQ